MLIPQLFAHSATMTSSSPHRLQRDSLLFLLCSMRETATHDRSKAGVITLGNDQPWLSMIDHQRIAKWVSSLRLLVVMILMQLARSTSPTLDRSPTNRSCRERGT